MELKMKAISVRQPWANLISWGQKSIEVRTWTTEHRGDLLIVSSANPKIAPAGTFHDAEDYRSQFPDGRIGSDPTLATPEIGKQLFEASVRHIGQVYEEFMAVR